MEFVKKNIKYIGLAGCIIVALANFLPFVTVSVSLFGISQSSSIKFIDGDGVFVIVLAIIAGAMLFGKTLKNLRIGGINLEKLLGFWWGPLVPLGIAAAITAYDAINVSDVAGSYGSYATISFGIGFYLILLGLIVAIASVLYEKFVMKVDNTVASASSVVPASTTTYADSVVPASTTTYAAPVQPVVMEAPVVEPVQPVVATPVMEPAAPVQQPVVGPAVVSCPGCGSQVPSTSKFCTTCGKQLQ